MTSVPATLADLTYMLAVELKSVREGLTSAEGGSLKMLVDTSGARAEADDYWNTGPAWILSTSNGSAPVGEFADVADFANGTVTLRQDLTATIPAGADYALGRRRYPLDILKQSVNAAYRDLGRIPQTDTSLLTLAQTTQYTIPAAARKDLRQVWIQTVDNIAADKRWVEIPIGTWRQENDLLYLPQIAIDKTIKLVYVDEAPYLDDYNDALSDFIHPKRVVYKAAVHTLLWRAEKLNPAAQSAVERRANYFLDLDLGAMTEHEIVLPDIRNRIMTLRRWMPHDDDFTIPPA